MRCYLGLDNGGTTTKASLFDSTGREIGTAGMRTQVSTPHPGFVERDMEEMWRANCQVIRRVLTETGVEGAQIAAVAVTQTENLGCAMAAATAAGDFPTLGEAAWAMCPPAVRVMPQPSLAQMYRKKYERYLRVMEACSSLHTAEKEEPFHV